jgi:hypothetical protein
LNLHQAEDDGAQATCKVASHADLETAMQSGLNKGEDGGIADLHDPDAIALTQLNILRRPKPDC